MTDLFDMLKPKEVVVAKKEEKPKKAEKLPTEKKEVKLEKFAYPFILHYAGENRDVSHIFEEGKEYTAEEVTKALLEHQYYEFSGKISYSFIEKDNILVPTFEQHKKG